MSSNESTVRSSVSGPPAWAFHLVPIELADHWRRLLVKGVFAKCQTVRLSTDVFTYFHDILRWIPTKDGSFDRIPIEPPLIDKVGAAVGIRIFARLQALFECGPEIVVLRGPQIQSGGPTAAWRANQLRIHRHELVEQFRLMLLMCRQTMDGNHYIYVSDLPERPSQDAPSVDDIK